MPTSQNEPNWLPADAIVQINQAEVDETGEPHLLVDRGLLESAAGRPYGQWAYGEERDVARLATSLISAICRNHPFQQGNKRTALTAGLTFVAINGYGLKIDDDARLGLWVEALVERALSEEDFAMLLREHLVAIDESQSWGPRT